MQNSCECVELKHGGAGSLICQNTHPGAVFFVPLREQGEGTGRHSPGPAQTCICLSRRHFLHGMRHQRPQQQMVAVSARPTACFARVERGNCWRVQQRFQWNRPKSQAALAQTSPPSVRNFANLLVAILNAPQAGKCLYIQPWEPGFKSALLQLTESGPHAQTRRGGVLWKLRASPSNETRS